MQPNATLLNLIGKKIDAAEQAAAPIPYYLLV
jgi:hypothetical protein